MRALVWLAAGALSLRALPAFAQPSEPAPETTPTPPAVPPAAAPEPPRPPEPASSEPKPQAGYLPSEGFFLRSPDDAFKLRFRLQSAIRAQIAVNGKAEFSNPFLTLRPILSGNLFKKWIRFWTSMELAANPVYLLDSYIEIQPCDAIGIDVGQMWTPFSRHEYLFGPHQLLFPDWNQVANYFWTGRDKGATLFGNFFDKKIDWFLGGYLGAPLRQFETIRGNYLFVARVAVAPLGPTGGTEFAYAEGTDPVPFRFAIGLNGFTSKVRKATENFNPATFQFDVVPTDETTVNHGLGADVFVQSSRVMMLAEGYYRRTDPRNGQPNFTSLGAFAQLGVLLYKRDLDVAVRGTWADVNLNTNNDRSLGIEVGGSYYIHLPELALKLRYGFGDQKGPSDGSSSVGGVGGVGGAALLLPPGQIHVVTAQINAAF